MAKVELTNMVMIIDRESNRVLVQERTKSPQGITFPGGHVEPGESIVDSAVREVREETGLEVKNLKHCGVIHWCNTQSDDRYLAFLYRT
ncbi:MAG: NUDIX domain-containing protein, partial [Proteocatella sp.]|nr:NUDIX domain-containing protein [Proteocatella sp.]